MQVVSMKDIGGEVVKDNEVYLLKDNKTLNNLVLSSTFLRANQNTTGHTHKGQEEVYMFVSGKGEMEIDGKKFNVREGDCVLIEDGEFHKVYNTGHLGLYFVCVFDGKRSH
ncbi:cupin domain-containing protein [bacterium]|jgi:mannose-6-phosphate isomerase-like protein (cupin superfamily)|nr:cupin domain-containing protein [bacterium]